jgi:hypothetical protein
MSCAGKGYGSNLQSNEYLYTQFISSGLISTSIPKNSIINGTIQNGTIQNGTIQNGMLTKAMRTQKCRLLNNRGYPSFTPELSGLSVTTSAEKVYTIVYVNGSNFLPNDTTFIKFGNLGYSPVTYNTSFNLSFVVPFNAVKGDYSVKVVNLYNGNFSPPVNQSYPGNLNFSQAITYTIT